MSKPFFYRITVADLAIAVMQIPEGQHKEWLHQLVKDLGDGAGSTDFSRKLISEVAEYRKKQAEHGARGGRPRKESDPLLA